ncbi:MAG: hypothetical protein AMJ81_08170, partial [Phycisphaerae bacterium SM23_33]
MALKTSDFDYDLPEGLIAQQPARVRDQSRLMVLDRTTGRRSHHMFRELPERLREGDVLVLNDTRVIPAMFGCHRRTGGRIEGLFLRELSLGRWQVMLRGGGRCRSGEVISLSGEDNCTLMLSKRLDAGVWEVAVAPPVPAPELLDRVGRTPLPPYIRRPGPMTDAQDRAAYQTVFAARPGAVAAPTAGLHFTEAVLEALRGRGVQL